MRQIDKPSICVVVQGAKEIILGEDTLRYGAMECLAVGMTLPATGQHCRGQSRPALYRCHDRARCCDDPRRAGTARHTASASREFRLRACSFGGSTNLWRRCVLRLLRMCETPKAIPILFPSVMREICYWLLSGPNGGELCKLAESPSRALPASPRPSISCTRTSRGRCAWTSWPKRRE